MGLGLLGGALNDIRYLANHGAELLVTDLKTREELKPSLAKLRKYKKIKFVLGKHRREDFHNTDMILQPGNVPIDSPYLAEAHKHHIPIFVSESLFAKYAEEAMMIGITGTRGKSTVTQLIYEILKLNYDLGLNQSAKSRLIGQKGFLGKPFLGGNVKNVSTLALLDQVKAGDIVVMELDSWALRGMGDIKKSPHIAVFTNLMVDHQNFYGSTKLTTGKNGMDLYFADKANIFLNQIAGDYLVCGRGVFKLIQRKYKRFSSQAVAPDARVVPKNWKIKLLGEHNRLNIAYAVTVARILDVPEKIIKKVVEDFKGVPGRLELIREIRGIKYYNDTTATTPDGVLAAIKALKPTLKGALKPSGEGSGKEGGIVLISGGTDKELEYKAYSQEVSKVVKALILFKGTATEKILKELRKTHYERRIKMPLEIIESMKNAMNFAKKYAQKGDIVLLSPGAASFEIFQNEFDRGEQFNVLVKKIK